MPEAVQWASGKLDSAPALALPLPSRPSPLSWQECVLGTPSPLSTEAGGALTHRRLLSLPDAASKHAALGFFDCLRAEVEEYDVVVSTVSPTFIRAYHAPPGQASWEASIFKCELFQGSPRNGWGGLGAGGVQ